jgi:hypothetical protein
MGKTPGPEALKVGAKVLRGRLPKANATRIERGKLKRALKENTVTASEIIVALPWWLKTMKAYQLLVHTPYVGGDDAAARILHRLKIGDNKNIGGLSERQRKELVAYLQALEAAKFGEPTSTK